MDGRRFLGLIHKANFILRSVVRAYCVHAESHTGRFQSSSLNKKSAAHLRTPGFMI